MDDAQCSTPLGQTIVQRAVPEADTPPAAHCGAGFDDQAGLTG